jgi:hypothetical protein
MKNNEVLGHKGRLKSSPKRLGSFTKERGGIYRLIFRVSALPSQLSAFERTCARILHQMGIIAFERKNMRSSAHTSELAKTCEM